MSGTTSAAAAPVQAAPAAPSPGALATQPTATPPVLRPTPAQPSTPTPRLLRGLRTALVVLLVVFTGLTVVGTVAPEIGLASSVGDISLGQQLRAARATLAQADREASVAFLDPAAATADGEWTTYQSDLDRVSAMLLRAAADDPADADALATVQTQISEYRRSVDAAWTTVQSSTSTGGQQFVATSSALDAPLATLAELAAASDTRVGSGIAWQAGAWAEVAGWLSVAGLVLASILVARRSHRVVNVGLAAGLLLVLVATSLAGQGYTKVQQSLTDVRTSSLSAARINEDTLTTAERAKAAEDRTLLVPSQGNAAWSALAAQLTASLDTLPDPGDKATQTALWNAYVTAHGTLATSTSPKEAGRTTTLTALVAFTQQAGTLAQKDADNATSTLNAAKNTQLPMGVGASVAALLALVAAVAGINRRLVEFG